MVGLQLNCASAVMLWKYYLMEVVIGWLVGWLLVRQSVRQRECADARPIFFLYTAEHLKALENKKQLREKNGHTAAPVSRELETEHTVNTFTYWSIEA